MGNIFNKGLKEEDKKEGLLKRVINIEDKSEKLLKAIENIGIKQSGSNKKLTLKTICFMTLITIFLNTP